MVSQADARFWLDRWDRQQEFYMADREDRFTVIADVVETASARPDPLIVDAGVGPGSLAVRLLDRLPRATVVGVDADELLLGLAGAAYADRQGLRLVKSDLRAPDWTDRLALARPADAVVSTTALHWLDRDELTRFYRDVARVLRPGGVLVNGDHLFDRPLRPELDRIAAQVSDRRAERVRGDAQAPEDWRAWWHAVLEAPELADLVRQRSENGFEHTSDETVSVDTHLEVLRTAGFSEVGTVWQYGNDRVLVAVA